MMKFLTLIVMYYVLIVIILDFFNPAQEINTTRNVWLKILEGSKSCKCLALGWDLVCNFSCQYIKEICEPRRSVLRRH